MTQEMARKLIQANQAVPPASYVEQMLLASSGFNTLQTVVTLAQSLSRHEASYSALRRIVDVAEQVSPFGVDHVKWGFLSVADLHQIEDETGKRHPETAAACRRCRRILRVAFGECTKAWSLLAEAAVVSMKRLMIGSDDDVSEEMVCRNVFFATPCRAQDDEVSNDGNVSLATPGHAQVLWEFVILAREDQRFKVALQWQGRCLNADEFSADISSSEVRVEPRSDDMLFSCCTYTCELPWLVDVESTCMSWSTRRQRLLIKGCVANSL